MRISAPRRVFLPAWSDIFFASLARKVPCSSMSPARVSVASALTRSAPAFLMMRSTAAWDNSVINLIPPHTICLGISKDILFLQRGEDPDDIRLREDPDRFFILDHDKPADLPLLEPADDLEKFH